MGYITVRVRYLQVDPNGTQLLPACVFVHNRQVDLVPTAEHPLCFFRLLQVLVSIFNILLPGILGQIESRLDTLLCRLQDGLHLFPCLLQVLAGTFDVLLPGILSRT